MMGLHCQWQYTQIREDTELHLNITGLSEPEVLRFILEGLERRHAAIVEKIAAIKAEISEKSGVAPKASKLVPTKDGRRLTKAGREAIAEAQRKRWAKKRREERAAARAKENAPGRARRKPAPKVQAATSTPEPAGDIGIEYPSTD